MNMIWTVVWNINSAYESSSCTICTSSAHAVFEKHCLASSLGHVEANDNHSKWHTPTDNTSSQFNLLAVHPENSKTHTTTSCLCTFCVKPCRLSLVQPTTTFFPTLTRPTGWDDSSMQYFGVSDSLQQQIRPQWLWKNHSGNSCLTFSSCRTPCSTCCVSPAEDVDVSVATSHRDAEFDVELARHIHQSGSGRQRHLQQAHAHTHRNRPIQESLNPSPCLKWLIQLHEDDDLFLDWGWARQIPSGIRARSFTRATDPMFFSCFSDYCLGLSQGFLVFCMFINSFFLF